MIPNSAVGEPGLPTDNPVDNQTDNPIESIATSSQTATQDERQMSSRPMEKTAVLPTQVLEPTVAQESAKLSRKDTRDDMSRKRERRLDRQILSLAEQLFTQKSLSTQREEEIRVLTIAIQALESEIQQYGDSENGLRQMHDAALDGIQTQLDNEKLEAESRKAVDGKRIESLERELETTKEALKVHQEELKKTKATLADMDTLHTKDLAKMRTLQNHVIAANDRKEELDKVSREMEKYHQELSYTMGTNDGLRDEINNAHAEVEKLTVRATSASEELSEAVRRAKQLESDLERCEEELLASLNSSNELKTKLRTAEGTAAHLRSNLGLKEQQIEQLTRDNAKLLRSEEDAMQRLSTLQLDNRLSQETIDTARDKERQAVLKAESLQDQLDKLQSALVVICVDLSASVRSDYSFVQEVYCAVLASIREGNNKTMVAVVVHGGVMSGTLNVLSTLQPITEDMFEILTSLDESNTFNGSENYERCLSYAQQVLSAQEVANKSIVVIGDGVAGNAAYLPQRCQRLKSLHIPVHSIAPSPSISQVLRGWDTSRIATETGGRSFYQNTYMSGLGEIFGGKHQS